MNNSQQKLIQKVLNYLSYRPRSRAEVVIYLQSKTNSADEISSVINHLDRHKLINDIEFSQWLISSRSRSRPRGSHLLKKELQSKGIDSAIISDQLSEVDQLTLAHQAIHSKLSRWSSLPYSQFRVKATRFLTYRGFPWNLIEEVVKKAYNQTHVNRK